MFGFIQIVTMHALYSVNYFLIVWWPLFKHNFFISKRPSLEAVVSWIDLETVSLLLGMVCEYPFSACSYAALPFR